MKASFKIDGNNSVLILSDATTPKSFSYIHKGCLNGNTVTISTSKMDANKLSSFLWKVRVLAFAVTIVMALVIYVYHKYEIEEYHTEAMRLEHEGNPQIYSYASKMSLMTTSLKFILNFSMFMIYFQLSMLGFGFSLPFHIPVILQFVIFFFYSHREIVCHVTIMGY